MIKMNIIIFIIFTSTFAN